MEPSELSDVKQRLAAEVDARRDLLLDVSHQIHARPELNYEEHFAHELLTQVLEGEGLAVTRQAGGLATAFRADVGDEGGGATVAVVCEYDALPGLGHACGHNVIAAAGLGAGLAAATLARELGGRLVVLGTPAEEGGGGKIKMLEAGVADGLDAALMIHPADAELAAMDAIAVQQMWATYTGEATHAAAQTEWMVRSPTLAGLAVLKERFLACLRGGAEAAGCELAVEWQDVTYADMVDNRAIGLRYAANAAALGREVKEPGPGRRVVGSTDMGNVSYAAPSIHPVIRVAPPGVSIHTPAFAAYAGGPEGDAAVLDGAKALAFTVADLWQDPGLVDVARAEWEADVAARGGDVQG